jgi:hypothetical protein
MSNQNEAEKPEEAEGPSLVSQLGSAPSVLQDDEFDMPLLTVLMDSEEIPDTYRCTAYWLARATINPRMPKILSDIQLKLNVAVRGRGRRDLLRAEQVRKGGQVNVESEITKPGWVERNITQRDWEEKQRRELQL